MTSFVGSRVTGLWACTGIEPVTSRTQPGNHTTRPEAENNTSKIQHFFKKVFEKQ